MLAKPGDRVVRGGTWWERRVVKLDHLSIAVSDWRRSRNRYVGSLGFKAEFDIPEGGRTRGGVAAIQDDAGLTIFLEQVDGSVLSGQSGHTLGVDDVDALRRDLAARGISIISMPAKHFWGYGAILADPDGHVLHLYDEVSMREKGG
jgi:catechol 2,3-dioxygenase-like lactoylglutathione lyase family enzyme